ncbi:MAG TPA: hypothetical protein VF014_07300 [Casimicrobiaceae bacterium]|nr:hypothetical protein [Casimicrobiaceae bacterium]
MRPLFSSVFGFVAFATLSHAQCAGAEGIAYRDTPCVADQQEQPFASGTKSESLRADSNAGRRSRPAGRQSLNSYAAYAGTPFAATTIFIGMTDTRVLNLPGWGRPTQIVRSKARQGWREQWEYKRSGDESHRLYFENGRLVEREDVTAPLMEARFSPEQ